MPSWLPSVPYPPPDQKGFWDPVTSTLQWCEEDYYATYYSAEIINTTTNFMFMWLAYEGLKSCRKYGHDQIFKISYIGYLLVSLGSFMFHSTLKYPWQLVDELNMIYTSCLMVYASLSYAQSKNVRIALGVGLTLFCAFVTAYYHFLQDPVFHQCVFAALSVFIVLRSVYIMETSLRPSLRHSEEKDRLAAEKRGELVRSKALQAYENQRDLETLKNMWVFVVFGVSVFLGGFALWGIDNACCSTLRSWRRSLGMPWGFFLELHGLWHIMTGLGGYCYIAWGIHLRHILNGNQDEYVLSWPAFYKLPEIVRKDYGNGYLNGRMTGYPKNYGTGLTNGNANGHVINGKAKY